MELMSKKRFYRIIYQFVGPPLRFRTFLETKLLLMHWLGSPSEGPPKPHLN